MSNQMSFRFLAARVPEAAEQQEHEKHDEQNS
jgi:hypothetical protein